MTWVNTATSSVLTVAIIKPGGKLVLLREKTHTSAEEVYLYTERGKCDCIKKKKTCDALLLCPTEMTGHTLLFNLIRHCVISHLITEPDSVSRFKYTDGDKHSVLILIHFVNHIVTA